MHDPPAGNPASAFRGFLADDWAQWLREYPELATVVGAPGLNDRWTDDSAQGIDARRRHLHEAHDRLLSFERGGLPVDQRLDYDLYRELLETALSGLEFGDDPLPYRFGMPHNLWMPLNQMEGIHQAGPDILFLQPRAKPSDYRDVLRRLERFPEAIDQNLELMRLGLARGYSPPKIAIRGTPDQVRGLLTEVPLESSLLTPFREFPSGMAEEERAGLVETATREYHQHLVPAVQRLLAYLTDTYLPACRESIGASALPGGAEHYRLLVRYQTTTDLTPQQIHDIGQAEVRRIRTAMDRVIAATRFVGDFAKFTEFLRHDPRFFFSDAETLVDSYRTLAKRIDPTLGTLFGRLPRLPYGVIPVPDYRAPSSPTAYYQSGAATTGRPGNFYVNTYDLQTRPKWGMEALALHEAVPGHHLQLALAEEVDGLPEYRKYSAYTAFVEGWGLYAESLGEELGFYRDPYSRFGQLDYDIWRAVRLVVDTGMHALGWSRDQAIAFFRENAGQSDHEIAVEVDRYIVWPGQALAYKIGQLKFRELRTFAERELGERFDVRAFHDLILEKGALPLGLVEERTREWVKTHSSPAN